jgi:hypothetical protein
MPTPPKRMRLAPETPPEIPLTKICEELKISPPKYLSEETRDRTEQMTLEAIEEKVALEGFGDKWPDRDHKRYLSFFTAVSFTMMRHFKNAKQQLETF